MLSGQRGYTLLELVVVLSIVGLITTLLAPRLTVPLRNPRPGLVTFLEGQRQLAITSGRTVHVYEMSGHIRGDTDEKFYDLPMNSHLNIVAPRSGIFLGRQLLAVFYADGTSVFSDFILADQAAPANVGLHITVTPLQGEIVYASN